MELYLTYILRLVVASVCGVIIGFERTNRAKEAGLRTHCIVACASCLMMLVSIYGFMNIPNITNRDPARIAAQIVSGIGFLGAGMVFVKHQMISGLTTAAGIWATAGIGMAIGCGMYVVGVSGTLLILLAQTILHFRGRFTAKPKSKIMTVKNIENADIIKEKFAENKITVYDTNIVKKNGMFTYVFYIEIPCDLNEEEFLRGIPYDCALKSEL
ncbi:MAG: MgtC/SapB family protein [Clostridia bacterium]|nr:MgtC/SapB family protein [Clostridia bacterium]